MDEALVIILKDTYSTVQLKHRLRILKDKLLQDFFGGDLKDSSSQGANSGTTQDHLADQAWLNSLPPDFFKGFSKDNVYKIFEDLEKKSQSLPTLTVYLPFELPESGLVQIGNQVRKMFSPNIILEDKLDLNLIAGCALGWKGVVRDYSLKSKIEAKKIEIMETFKKFLRADATENAKEVKSYVPTKSN